MTYYIVVGTSEPQDFGIQSRGQNISGAGLTPTLEISRDVDGVLEAVPSPPTVAWLDQPEGRVRVTGVQTLSKGTYLVRSKLTDGGGGLGFAPNGPIADVWEVVDVWAKRGA